MTFVEDRPFFYNPSTQPSYSPTESTSFLSLPHFPSSVDAIPPPPPLPSLPVISIPDSTPSITTAPVEPPSAPPPLSPSKPPITKVYIHRPKEPSPHPLSSASPNTPVCDDSNNIDESHVIFDELQASPRYNLRDRATIGPADKYGFSRVNAVVHEPSTYQEASGVLEWQLAMSEELAGTWDIVPLPSHAVPITCKWVFKIMTKSDASIERYKARLVAQGLQ